MWIIYNIEYFLHLPHASSVYLPPLLSSRFFTILDIRDHTKLVLYVYTGLLSIKDYKHSMRAYLLYGSKFS